MFIVCCEDFVGLSALSIVCCEHCVRCVLQGQCGSKPYVYRVL